MATKLKLEDFGIKKLSDAITEVSPVKTSRVSGKKDSSVHEQKSDG